MKSDLQQSKSSRPSRPAIMAFVATAWIAFLPLIVGWNGVLESGDPGVGLGALTFLAVAFTPIVGWAVARNITELGVEHAQRPAFCALLLVGAVWMGGLHLHLTGGLWLGKCTLLDDADACLAAGDYFDSGDAALQGTVDAKDLWELACVGGGEVGWKGCRKLVHSAGYRATACEALYTHCSADDRNLGACWDWGVVCNRERFVDDEVDEVARKLAESERSDGHDRLPTAREQAEDYSRCLDHVSTGVAPSCDRTLDRGILHQRRAVCAKIDESCRGDRSWACRFAVTRCSLLSDNPYD